jgi:hypothetical protein
MMGREQEARAEAAEVLSLNLFGLYSSKLASIKSIKFLK